MYKLVVVEDERDVRRRLVSLIERTGAEFEIVSEYENGIDAYDGIIVDAPDLVLTDIKIPYISGIELARRLREVLPLVMLLLRGSPKPLQRRLGKPYWERLTRRSFTPQFPLCVKR